ncbi:TlpA family protein disulfide reductase [Chitinophaga sp. 22321]|uniref:TlpA family protein disulfide reductase n=1 Tax=Chitinophaga hostae TaxID=2831022 RepID=A0ABS5J202_9BACT|nr:TlpA disulfide reductase family protein [Chitinophaga hostae]MBS0029175.1 TlpA family protein disulfide reductase [Chitinophaga hostae]
MLSLLRLLFAVFNIILLITSLPIFSSGQTSHDNNTSNTTITFKLLKGSQLFISYPRNIIQFREIALENVTQDSTFTITVNTNKPFIINSSYMIRNTYLFFPGYHYSADIRKGETTITFQCSDQQKAFESNALAKMEAATMRLDLSADERALKYLYQRKQYNETLDSFLLALKSQRLEKINDYKRANSISDEGYRLLSAYIHYDFISKRLMPFYHPKFDVKDLPVWYADTMHQYRRAFDDSSLLRLYSFQGALIYNNRFLATDSKNGTASLPDQFTAAKKFTGSPEVNNFLLYQVLNNHKNKQDSRYPVYVDSFRLVCTDTLYQNVILKNFSYLAKENVLATTKQQLYTLQSKTIDLDSLITQQKKLIYIDCWANWCAPCKREMPISAQLQKEFAKKNISFLFFSLDETATQWEAAAGDYAFMNKANSFLVLGNFQSPFVLKHHIDRIPRYILMSNDGKIIDDDAPHPDDPELKTLINGQL